jgi:iron complex outermembrane recepter protein
VQYGSIFTRPFNESPSWDQVDLRAEWRGGNGRYSVILFGKNIFNTTGYVSGSTAVFQTDGSFIKDFTLTPPATAGIEFQYRFF